MALNKHLIFLLVVAMIVILSLIGVLVYVNYTFVEKVAEVVKILGELGVLVNG